MREAEGQVKTHLAEVVYSSGCHREAYALVNAAVDAIMTLHAFAYALLEGGVFQQSIGEEHGARPRPLGAGESCIGRPEPGSDADSNIAA